MSLLLTVAQHFLHWKSAWIIKKNKVTEEPSYPLSIIFLFNSINITGCKVLQAFKNSPHGPLVQGY